MNIRQYADAIASIESAGSGGYSAVGPLTAKGNRAYGRYQVMDFNVGPWTERHFGTRLTPEEFLKNQKAQDAVFAGEFGSYVQKYGNPQDAASMWFTGRPAAQGADKSDILGTTGSGYVNKFNAALGVGGKMQPTSTPPMMEREEEKTDFREVAGNLAVAFNSLRHRPDPNIVSAIQNVREQRSAKAAKNKTMDFLKKAGREDLLGLIDANVIGGKDAVSIMMKDAESMRSRGQLAATAEVLAKHLELQGNSEAAQFVRANPTASVIQNVQQSLLSNALGVGKAEPTSAMQNYEFLISQGVAGDEAMARAFGKGATNINLGAGETAWDKGIGEQGVEIYKKIQNEAVSAQDMLTSSKYLETLMRDPNFSSGALAEPTMQYKKIIEALGGDPAGVGSLEAFQAVTSQMILDKMGGSLGAGFSEGDRQFVERMAPQLSTSKVGNEMIIQMNKLVANRKLQIAEFADQYIEENGRIDENFMRALREWSKQNPIFDAPDASSYFQ